MDLRSGPVSNLAIIFFDHHTRSLKTQVVLLITAKGAPTGLLTVSMAVVLTVHCLGHGSGCGPGRDPPPAVRRTRRPLSAAARCPPPPARKVSAAAAARQRHLPPTAGHRPPQPPPAARDSHRRPPTPPWPSLVAVALADAFYL